LREVLTVTKYRCAVCGYGVEKDDGKAETIKGLCGECYEQDPGSVKKLTYRALKFKGVHYERV
jgi:NMD protein affecting ribosome stability and mRNA decay